LSSAIFLNCIRKNKKKKEREREISVIITEKAKQIYYFFFHKLENKSNLINQAAITQTIAESLHFVAFFFFFFIFKNN
jgi:hypothetical protein